MRRITIAALGVLFAGSIIGNAQQPTPPTFRAGTTLVDFTVVAVDARGNPVTDLRRDEISIVEDDSSRDVAFFQFEGASGSRPSPDMKPLRPGTFTNRTEYAPGAPRNLVAVVLDFVNASLGEQFELRAQFLHYLKQIPADAQVGLYILRDNAVAVHDFTRDAGSLRSRIENGDLDVYARALAGTADIDKLLAGARPDQMGSLAALAQANARAVQDYNVHIAKDRRSKTLSALDSVGAHLAALPGRKSVVWISHGFPLINNMEGRHVVDEVRGISQRLANEDVAVYPVDAGGLRAYRGNPLVAGRVEGTNELVASITGGRVTRNNNDLTLGLAAAAEDLRGTYSLGFYAVTEPDNEWHRLSVKVARPGVRLRHRQGYLAASIPAGPLRAWTEDQWNDLAFRPLISTAVRLDARATFDAGTLKVSVDVASDDLTFHKTDTGVSAEVDIAVVEKIAAEPTNVRVQSASIDVAAAATLPARVPVASEFALNRQTESVRVIVRDKSTGRYGSVDVPLSQLAAP